MLANFDLPNLDSLGTVLKFVLNLEFDPDCFGKLSTVTKNTGSFLGQGLCFTLIFYHLCCLLAQ